MATERIIQIKCRYITGIIKVVLMNDRVNNCYFYSPHKLFTINYTVLYRYYYGHLRVVTVLYIRYFMVEIAATVIEVTVKCTVFHSNYYARRKSRYRKIYGSSPLRLRSP